MNKDTKFYAQKILYSMTLSELEQWIEKHNLPDGEVYFDELPSYDEFDEDNSQDDEFEYRSDLESIAHELLDSL